MSILLDNFLLRLRGLSEEAKIYFFSCRFFLTEYPNDSGMLQRHKSKVFNVKSIIYLTEYSNDSARLERVTI